MVARRQSFSSRLTFKLDDFAGGLDLGAVADFASAQNRWKVLKNVRTTKDRTIQRRPPCKLFNTVDGRSQGLIYIGTQAYVIASKAANVVTPIVVPSGVTALLYDCPYAQNANPDTFILLDAVVFNGSVCALLAQTEDTGGSITRVMLHVFDNAPDLPTYVTDAEFPWKHSFGGNARLTICANKLVISGPDGNTFYSGIQNARKWNSRDVPSLISGGYEFHYYAPVNGSQDVIIPVNQARLDSTTGKDYYSCYSVEKLIGTPTGEDYFLDPSHWGDGSTPGVPLTEKASSPSTDEYVIGTQANAAGVTTYTNWTKLTINGVLGKWYRFRWFPPDGSTLYHHTNEVISGGIPLNYDQNVLAYYGPTWTFLGDGAQTIFDLPDNFIYGTPVGATSKIAFNIYVNGVAPTYTTNYTLVPGVGTRMRIVFVAAPANGAAIDFQQITLAPGGAGSGDAWLAVPPAKVKTWSGQYDVAGANVQLLNNHSDMVYYPLDANGVPSAPVARTTADFGSLRFTGAVLCKVVVTGAVGVFTREYALGDALWLESERNRLNAFAGVTDAGQDSGFLPTASHDSGGGLPTVLGVIKDRLIVVYTTATQMWSMHADGAQDALIDVGTIGSGQQLFPHATLTVFGLVVPMGSGFWTISATSQLSDRMRNDRIGDRLEKGGVISFYTGVYWPWLGSYLAFAGFQGENVLLNLDFSGDSKFLAWSKWYPTGINSIDTKTMNAVNDKLYFRSNNSIYYFDASEYTRTNPSFRDVNDAAGAGNAYLCRAVGHYNYFGRPDTKKQLVFIDIVQQGTCTPGFLPLGYDETIEQTFPPITGVTIGKQRIGLNVMSEAMCHVFESTDETGWELQHYSLHYRLMGK
jgi:hypothetical protein